MLSLRDARAGVATTMSGKSASKERWTTSDVLWARLTVRTSFAQKADNLAQTPETWSASSRVGTRIRAVIAFSVELTWVALSEPNT